ncbi:P-loop NTPase [Gorillibacterium timonense]|uniref:P-loop NTPase n=1 Tax=Gorillibacterium timonense TaxID=1689269 RepID=UPI00071C5CC7|nr:P-loop NTPase [Gorillibacterium timonense]
MVTREQILEVLSGFYDGGYHQPAVELGLIRDIMIKGSRVALTYVLTEEGANTALYKHEMEEALRSIGVMEPHIRFRPITEYEREALEKKLGVNRPVQGSSSPTAAETGDEVHGGRKAAGSLLDPTSQTRFLAVASGKGGVGKSTVTVNLAVALARMGRKVGIIDADIYGFSVPDMMGIEERPVAEGDKIIPVERFGVKVISMGFFVEDNAPIIWRGPMLGKMLQNFFQEVEWGELDYLLLDLPPGTGDVALDVHQMLPGSQEIIVTTPHATAAFVAARAGAMALHTGHGIVGIVENMSHYVNRLGEVEYVFGRGGGAKLAEELHTELLAQIPLGAPDNAPADPDFSPSVYKSDTETGRLYDRLAEQVASKLETV